jgi:chaperone BCS1
VFFQPLFYIAENIKLQILKDKSIPATGEDTPSPAKSSKSKTLPDSVLDTNLKIVDIQEPNTDIIKCAFTFDTYLSIKSLLYQKSEEDDEEFHPHRNYTNIIEGKREKIDPKLLYSIDRTKENLEIKFEYKEQTFWLKILDTHKDKLVETDKFKDFTQFSQYEIKFATRQFNIFEEFIKTSIDYFDKYYLENSPNTTTIKIYNSNDDGYMDLLCNKRKRAMESIYLPKKKKEDLINDLDNFLKPETKALYHRLGINYKRTYLFEGVPGSGKTSFIFALASKYNYDIGIIHFTPKLTDAGLLSMIHSVNKRNKYMFIIFEDIDCLFKERKNHDDRLNAISFSGLLNLLDGLGTNENAIYFMTTNYKHNLDSALIRPGRVDNILNFDYAVKEQIIDMFGAFTNCTDDDKKTEFYKACKRLSNLNITTAILQQYLIKYINNPTGAIDSIDELKTLYDLSDVSTEAEKTGLFS